MVVDKQNITELIRRYEIRKKQVWRLPNPYIQPLFEKSEIQSMIDKLKKKIE